MSTTQRLNCNMMVWTEDFLYPSAAKSLNIYDVRSILSASPCPNFGSGVSKVACVRRGRVLCPTTTRHPIKTWHMPHFPDRLGSSRDLRHAVSFTASRTSSLKISSAYKHFLTLFTPAFSFHFLLVQGNGHPTQQIPLQPGSFIELSCHHHLIFHPQKHLTAPASTTAH